MPPRTIAIGDIHGCRQALVSLIEAVAPESEDTIITLGDYVDRGPDSKGVIDVLLALRSRCRLVTLRGNHEEMLLQALRYGPSKIFQYWLDCGGTQTLESYGGSPAQIPDEHCEFLRSCLRYYETDTHVFVHANYQHNLAWELQSSRYLLWAPLEPKQPPHQSGKIVVVGHTTQKSGEILDRGHLICLDTDCYGGGWLSAYEVHTQQLWQADVHGKLRDA